MFFLKKITPLLLLLLLAAACQQESVLDRLVGIWILDRVDVIDASTDSVVNTIDQEEGQQTFTFNEDHSFVIVDTEADQTSYFEGEWMLDHPELFMLSNNAYVIHQNGDTTSLYDPSGENSITIEVMQLDEQKLVLRTNTLFFNDESTLWEIHLRKE